MAVKRVYAAVSPGDGFRVLVDRLWPRGLSKEKAKIDLWLKDAAPSHELRVWFDHQPGRWPHFLRRYRLELQANSRSGAAFERLKLLVRENPRLTLLFGAKEEHMNNAVALKRFLDDAAPFSTP
ncbi:MAG: DUF488 family protein [Pseudomonadota bacterium]